MTLSAGLCATYPHTTKSGVGTSGIGAYHGQNGFDRFSHLEPVLHHAKRNGMSLAEPPYTGLKVKVCKAARKIL